MRYEPKELIQCVLVFARETHPRTVNKYAVSLIIALISGGGVGGRFDLGGSRVRIKRLATTRHAAHPMLVYIRQPTIYELTENHKPG